jgi:DNA-binding CsgD family transcriptional regulator
VLVGREAELRRVTALLDEARRGRSGTLLVVGDPGVGKTALLEEGRALATDMRVLDVIGVESESELPFASLHALFRPVLDLLPRIPTVQARALAAALALEEGEPDVLTVGAGTLSLLVEATAESPVLVVVDDAHWLDRASAEALAFAARRLIGEELAMLAALRPGPASTFDVFPRLEVGPLAPGDSRRLLRQRSEPVPVAEESRLLAAAAGNPLALLELPATLAQELPATTTSHERLEKAFAARLDALPRQARLGLLLAAAEPDPATVRRAAEHQELSDPLGDAEAAGLIRIGNGTLTFRHPVVRSLVYATAASADRAAAHRTLAAALTDEVDADRRAWHLAAAAEGPDETIAALLEQTAERAIARGGRAAAARGLERAAHLSPGRADRARRLVAALESHRVIGNRAKVLSLADEALALEEDHLRRADIVFRVFDVTAWTARVDDSALLAAVDDPELDDERRVKLLILAVAWRADRWDAEGAGDLSRRLEHHAEGSGPHWADRARAQAAIAYLLAGDRDRAVRLLRPLAQNHAIPTMAGFEWMSLEWFDELRMSLERTLREARSRGDLRRVAWNRVLAAHLELRHGRLSAAEAAAAEALQLGEILGDPKVDVAAAALAGVQAWRGQAAACTTNARLAAASARNARDRFPEGLAGEAVALLAMGLGQPDEAVAELEPLASAWLASSVADPAHVPFVPELVEAYVQTDAANEARRLLERFQPLADAAGNIWMRGACARCAGLLAPADAFDAPFASAIALLDRSPYALDLARARLAYGERLRRAGRRRDARVQLRPAHDLFAAAGATPWQERAAAELRATGERVVEVARPHADLTPQELNISRLVAEGKTNKEIAAALYLSPKTIEYHLGNTFRKLDIHSRAELARIVS